MIRWDIPKTHEKLIQKIVARARRENTDLAFDPVDLEMDLIACHRNGNRLRLADLLEADAANFGHDIWGIRRFINRETGRMASGFLPRFSAPGCGHWSRKKVCDACRLLAAVGIRRRP